MSRPFSLLSAALIAVIFWSASTAQTSPVVAIRPSPGNWSQLARLTPPAFSSSLSQNLVGISGDTLVIGGTPLGGASNTVASVFLRTVKGWLNTPPVATLSGPIPSEPYPSPVAIDGDTIVAAGDIGFFGYTGYAFVYVKPAGGWTNMTPTAVLSSSNTSDLDFGGSVAVRGDTVIVGSNGYLSNSTGTVYVYVKPAGGWHDMTETAKLTASDGLVTDLFGWSVSISGGTAVVGATQFDILNHGPGKAYVFVKPASGWTSMTQTAELTASDSSTEEDVGFSVAADGNVVLVGAPVVDHFLGAVLLFEKPASGWTDMTETARLTPGDGLTGGNFGDSLGISGKIVVVGTPNRGDPPNGAAGGVYVFEEPAAGWQDASSHTVLTCSDTHYSAYFGYHVAASGRTIVGDAEGSPAGTAYVFEVP
jgi:hypothetical protein